MTAVVEYDVGDNPQLTLTVTPAAGDTSVTALATAPGGGTSNPAMTPNADRSVWTGTGPALSSAGEWTIKFTITGTGAGVEYLTIWAETPPPLSTDLRHLRLLIPDTDPTNRMFRVSELQDLLDLESGNVRLAAAQALDVIASSEVMISKKIRTQDLSTDGPAVAAELRARATSLRAQVEAGYGDDEGGFDIVDFDPTGGQSAELAEDLL